MEPSGTLPVGDSRQPRHAAWWRWRWWRLALLPLIGTVLWTWHARSPEARSLGYYFSQWRAPEALSPRDPFAKAQERLQNVSDPTVRAQLILDALEADPGSNSLAAAYQNFVDRWPGEVRRCLPLPYATFREYAGYFLPEYAGEAVFAQALVARWSHWDAGSREFCLNSLPTEAVAMRPEYIAPLLEALQATNAALGIQAARLALAYDPLPPTLQGAMAAALRGFMDDPSPALEVRAYRILDQLTLYREVPAEWLRSLKTWLGSSNRLFRATTYLALAAQTVPQVPTGMDWKLATDGLSSSEEIWLLQRMRMFGYRRAVRSIDCQAWLLALAHQRREMEQRATNSLEPANSLVALELMEELGPAGAALAEELMTFFEDPDPTVRLRAARAFAAVAPPVSGLAEAVAAHLKDATVATPLLLWLASCGTNGVSAASVVTEIATNRRRFERPMQWERLLERPHLTPKTGRSPVLVWRKASQILVDAQDSCPVRLLRYWPRNPRTKRASQTVRSSPDGAHLPQVTLDEIAVLSLARLLPPESTSPTPVSRASDPDPDPEAAPDHSRDPAAAPVASPKP